MDVSPFVLPLLVAGAVGYGSAEARATISACLTLMGIATFGLLRPRPGALARLRSVLPLR